MGSESTGDQRTIETAVVNAHKMQAEIERLKAQLAGSDKLIETLCEQARLAVEKEMLLNAQLAASEEKRKVLARECLAWREHKGINVLSTLDYPIRKAWEAVDAAKALEAP